MPKRPTTGGTPPLTSQNETSKKSEASNKYDEFVDLSFLPAKTVVKIVEIYERFYNLGVAPYRATIETVKSYPTQVSSLSSEQVGDYLAQYTAWHSFLSDKAKYVAVALSVVNQQLEEMFDSKMAGLHGTGGNIKTHEAVARSQEGYVTLKDYRDQIRNLKSMVDADVERYDRMIQSLSREVSRREHNAGF